MTTAGLTALRRIALARESLTAKGTAVTPPTYKMHGTCTVTPEPTWHSPVDEQGSFAEFRRDVITGSMSRIRYEADLDFENVLYALSNAVRSANAGTAATVDGVSIFPWNFTPAIATRSNPLSYTWYYEDDENFFQIPFAICENLELSWAAGDPMGLRMDMYGHEINALATSPFGTLADRDIEEILTHGVSMRIADTYAGVGTGTDIADHVLGGTIRLRTNYMPKRNVSDSKEYSYITEARRHLEIDIDFRASSAWRTERAKWLSAGLRAVEVKFPGASTQELVCTAIGRYMGNPNLFDDADGENVARMSLHSRRVSNDHFGFSVKSKMGALL